MQDDTQIVYQSLHNPTNRYLTINDLKLIFQKAGILEELEKNGEDFTKWDLPNFQRAFTHISYTHNRTKKQGKNVIENEDDSVIPSKCIPIQEQSMERLEWLGDSIIQSIVGVYIWERFPNQEEGFYTIFRSKLVKTEALAQLGGFLGFNPLLIISKHTEDYCNGRTNAKHLEDAFEAFIGSLWEQTGEKYKYDIVKKFIINSIETKIDIPMLIIYNDNYKDILMRYYQCHFDGKFPTYSSVNMEEISQGEDKAKRKVYTESVKDIYGHDIAFGSAKSKKEAQQISAKEACKMFGLRVSDGINYYLKTIWD
jgi:dsRNA-specific ribonuclease